jgi:hypothetical protein
MRLMIWVGDEGPTDYDFKDGDVWNVQPNSWTPSTTELKKWLIAELPEYGGTQSELVEPEYGNGLQPNGMPVQRHARKYTVRYWEKLIPEELAAVRDPAVEVPVMTGRFGLFDIERK